MKEWKNERERGRDRKWIQSRPSSEMSSLERPGISDKEERIQERILKAVRDARGKDHWRISNSDRIRNEPGRIEDSRNYGINHSEWRNRNHIQIMVTLRPLFPITIVVIITIMIMVIIIIIIVMRAEERKRENGWKFLYPSLLLFSLCVCAVF